MKRKDGESYKDYCLRRKIYNYKIKQYLRHGALIWNSSKKKTYVRVK